MSAPNLCGSEAVGPKHLIHSVVDVCGGPLGGTVDRDGHTRDVCRDLDEASQAQQDGGAGKQVADTNGIVPAGRAGSGPYRLTWSLQLTE